MSNELALILTAISALLAAVLVTIMAVRWNNFPEKKVMLTIFWPVLFGGFQWVFLSVTQMLGYDIRALAFGLALWIPYIVLAFWIHALLWLRTKGGLVRLITLGLLIAGTSATIPLFERIVDMAQKIFTP